jgi:hypothetical protein
MAQLLNRLEKTQESIVFGKDMELKRVYKYKDEQNITEFCRSSKARALVNFVSRSVLPIALAAAVICLNNSCKRRNALMIVPSKCWLS